MEHAERLEQDDLGRAVALLSELRTERTPAHALYVLRNVGFILNGQLTEAVATARTRGLSWAEIGDAMNMTKAGAYDKYKSIDPLREMSEQMKAARAELGIDHLKEH